MEHTRSFPWQHVTVAVAGMVGALALLFLSTTQAHAALIDDVNDAILEAGAPLTVERSNAFQVGVHIGHYTTFDQLVGAIAYHKERGTLPTFTRKNPVVATQCLRGTVTSLSNELITLQVDRADGAAYEDLHLASNQYTMALWHNVHVGSTVTACSTDSFYSVYGHLSVH